MKPWLPMPRRAPRTSASCPHCHKPFAAELIAGGAERHRGFKCPHCKLFVPASRADGTETTPAELRGAARRRRLLYMQFLSACASGRPSSFFSVLFSI